MLPSVTFTRSKLKTATAKNEKGSKTPPIHKPFLKKKNFERLRVSFKKSFRAIFRFVTLVG